MAGNNQTTEALHVAFSSNHSSFIATAKLAIRTRRTQANSYASLLGGQSCGKIYAHSGKQMGNIRTTPNRRRGTKGKLVQQQQKKFERKIYTLNIGAIIVLIITERKENE